MDRWGWCARHWGSWVGHSWAQHTNRRWLHVWVNTDSGLLGSEELSWETTLHTCHNSLMEKWRTSSVTLLGEDSQKLAPAFLQTLPHVPFFFCWFCFVSFWQNKSRTEFYKFLSLIKEPGGGLGYPRHTPLSLFWFFILHLTGFPWVHILINCGHPNPWHGLCLQGSSWIFSIRPNSSFN